MLLFLETRFPSVTASASPATNMSVGSGPARLVGWRSRYSAKSESEPRPSGTPHPALTSTVRPSCAYAGRSPSEFGRAAGVSLLVLYFPRTPGREGAEEPSRRT